MADRPSPRQRPTYARDHTPVDDAEPEECPHCGSAELRVIHRDDDGAQFYRLYRTERHCAACGGYFPESFRAPG